LASSGIDAPVSKVLAGCPVDLAKPWGILERAKEPRPEPALLGYIVSAAAAAIIFPNRWGREMALLRRELYRHTTGPDVTHADRWALVFDTDSKSLYVEHDEAHLEARIGGIIDVQTSRMDVAEYLKCGGQTAGHRELWRLLRTLFDADRDVAEGI
jgi:hypothetical protein